MKKLFASLTLFLFVFHACPVHLIAQDSDEEEVFELSPFQVSSGRNSGYRSKNTLAGTRLKTDLKDVGAAINVLDASFFQDSGASILDIDDANESHYAYASGIIVRFAVGYYDDLEKNRRKGLTDTLAKIHEKAASDRDLYYTPGALKVSKGDRKKMKSKPKSYFTSYAHFSLSFTLEDGLSALKRVAAVRQLIAAMELDTEITKVYYGEALLLTESPFSNSAYEAPISPMIRSARATSDIGASLPYLTNVQGQKLRESIPLCSVTLIKPADSVCLKFAIDTQSGLEEERIQVLNSTLDTIRSLLDAHAGLSFIPGSILLRHGDSIGDLAKPQASFTSQAQFSVAFEVNGNLDAMQRIASIRTIVQSAKLPEAIHKVHFGSASLILDNPQAHHTEILKAIFKELADLQQSVGESFEVVPQIQHKRVQQRRHSLTEVELWIPYDYKIESVRLRELEERKMMLEHERALAANQAAAHHCHHCESKTDH
ncbi:hypothetical protein [Pelagicoccus mobilis]|uniref:Uncharacterized protein n=1 Tax=Pelagicoccus mobilis TaxID=415221 RepID=A0A934RTW2_9BACT|nr:hypothetical protein [Pelagicoccus mobilis]MBK1877525.1 hypothetical protein [Pelagicoccus mobilis]